MWFDMCHITYSSTCNATGSLVFMSVYVCGDVSVRGVNGMWLRVVVVLFFSIPSI